MEQERRLVDDARRDGQLAFHALGIRFKLAASRLAQIEHIQQLSGAGAARIPAHAVKRSAEGQVFKSG